MKRVIQLVLFLILILISIIVYLVYFSENEKVQIKTNIIKSDQSSNQTKNNMIKNLKYEVTFDQNSQYIITADLSEITYDNNVELVTMQKVIAIFIDKNNIPLIITSDKAIYNNSNYNTNFSENIQIEYMDNTILADYMDLDFSNDIIKIYENITYKGTQGTIKTDNIKIDLITKKIDIYMTNKNDNVEVITSK
tara:strand:- start:43 stop:624 length:582 start_codon:yes stop_codon:yes gene_type:complete